MPPHSVHQMHLMIERYLLFTGRMMHGKAHGYNTMAYLSNKGRYKKNWLRLIEEKSLVPVGRLHINPLICHKSFGIIMRRILLDYLR